MRSVSGGLVVFVAAATLACVLSEGNTSRLAHLPTPVATYTPMPTFTPTATQLPSTLASTIDAPALPAATPLPPATTVTDASPVPTATSLPPTPTPTDAAVPPTATALPPSPTPVPIDTPPPVATPDTAASFIEYVIAGTSRSMDCRQVKIYGSVLNAGNQPLPGVTVEVVGIHDTTGRHEVQTDDAGRYQVLLGTLNDVPSGQWYVAVVRDNQEVSERFHWASTSVCQSDDLGHSQQLMVDWKLVE